MTMPMIFKIPKNEEEDAKLRALRERVQRQEGVTDMQST